MKLRDLLPEGYAWEWKSGEPLPTLEDVARKHAENQMNNPDTVTEGPPQMTPIAKVVNQKLNELGFRAKVTELTDKWDEVQGENIDLSKTGVFGNAFDKASVRVYVAGNAELAVIRLVYKWTHPSGGSNGIEVRHSLRNNKWKVGG